MELGISGALVDFERSMLACWEGFQSGNRSRTGLGLGESSVMTVVTQRDGCQAPDTGTVFGCHPASLDRIG
ncbi:Hepatocyte growth factor receptor [Dissostichus eleginoides]|uniref:Hepatocyte growth factor receptor n=1 Tax=Dissostichus eleginoides TaxID=100907 RepID=A0AAD9B8E2_DISEL|nr:Hepatocyte growth factor receptor [Dissostichus eleginoides]